MKCISIFKCNPQIEVIDKSHCSLEDVPNFQNYSRSLEELFLDANKLTILNDNVFRLTRLRRFSFSDNAIQDIPPDIAKLVNLVELDCSRNKIRNIPDQIKFLRGLQVCDFSANDIQYLPTGLVQLKNLTSLTLNYCPIRNLPEDFGLLKNLEHLELRENEIEYLPTSISGLESLKKLDIGRNIIVELPDDIGRLTNLEYLFADGNMLETVSPKIGRLDKLQCLDLGQQTYEQDYKQPLGLKYGLRYLPDEIMGMVSLTDLNLSDNQLKKIPDGIRNLKNLIILKIDNNYLTELNPNIGSCTSLQELVLTSNSISSLPSSIGHLTDLRSLNIDNNLLKELPPQIGNLKRLRILSLRDNLLTYLPHEIGYLEMAKVMDVSGNRLEYLPISITSLNLKALWLSKNQAQPLPKLQIDELANSDTQVLTCYLLPQQCEIQEDDHQTNAMQQANLENYDPNRQAAVSFDTAAVDDAELSNDANFVRHDTPHPRELRARHQKLFTPVTCGKPEFLGHDNASFMLADNNREYDNNLHEQDPKILAYDRQQLEYESNGLPEMPTAKPIQTQNSNLTSRISHQSSGFVGYDNGGAEYLDNQENPRSFKENGDRGKMQTNYKDITQDYIRKNDSNELDDSKCYVLDILVKRGKNHKPGLGLSIAGGKDTPPFKDNDEGIFVSKVTRGGPAEAAGVKVGDKILAVNKIILPEGITHQKAVDIFKRVKPDCREFLMKILRDPNDDYSDQEVDEYSVKESILTSTNTSKLNENNNSNFTRTYTIPVPSEASNVSTMNNLRQYLMKEPTEKIKSTSSTMPSNINMLDGSLNKNIIYTTLVKDYKHDLGLVLENKVEEETRSNWSNIIISDILPNSIASRDGKLQIDDKLLSINGTDVTGIDLDRIMLILESTERFIRIVVSRGDYDDPIGNALRNMPIRPSLGSWFSSTSNMTNRPSLIESYQRPTFGSVSSLQKQPPNQGLSAKPPKPPKPSYLTQKDSVESTGFAQFDDDNPIARPRGRGALAAGSNTLTTTTTTTSSSTTNMTEESTTSHHQQISDLEKKAVWRRERLKSIDDDVEMAKIIAEAQRRQRGEK